MSDVIATGRCYCEKVKYKVTGKPVAKGQCHCRECQYISGGAAHYFMMIPGNGFAYTEGTPKSFTRPELSSPVSREFCKDCGTHILTRRNDFDGVILKVGTLKDPALFGVSKLAIFTKDMQLFHTIPNGIPAFEGMPTRQEG